MENQRIETPSARLLSLDLLRGFIMVLLALESAGLYEHLERASAGTAANGIMQQFFHHPWNGLHFWDLIQPGFMFIAGTAMAFSLHKQYREGVSYQRSFIKTLKRSCWLFFWGVLDYAVKRDGSLSFELWDVLTQLSFTTLVTFLVFRWNYAWQVTACVLLLLLTEVLYRFTNIPGYDHPFVNHQNFGNFMDRVLMHKTNSEGWVAINCIPTSVHTIAGAMAGKYLLAHRKVDRLLLWSAITLVVGYTLHFADITPVIKKIATSSFTLASLGWCLAALAFAYWWIDIKQHKEHLLFFTVAGMNPLFIYLFFEIIGHRWFNGYISALSNGLMTMAAPPSTLSLIITSLVIFSLEWGICYFLYRKKIFFKL